MSSIVQVWSALAKWPLGLFELALASALRTCSRPMLYLLSVVGFTSTRTPGSELPPTVTCPTPSICDSFCARTVEATSYIRPLESVSEVSAMISTGASDGFTFL